MPKVLHTDEVVDNVVLFMIAGYETTSTALAYSTYILATKPDIQEKLAEEIDQKVWNNNEATELYDIATNLSYLDMFLREVLRMYPIAVRVLAHNCNTTTTVCGHIIEEGQFDIQILKIYNCIYIPHFFI
jgi:cytochrome P450 family 3 subfamily A